MNALIAAFVLAAAPAFAATPREEFKTLTAQLQTTPDDDALRGKVIALALTLKPAPAIPEEAREPFVMGATILKKADGPAGARKAADLFTKAIGVAPWFADAYYNRALAREAAGDYASAMDDLKLYLKFKLPANDRRQAQDKIYALKANAELASEKKGEQDKVDRAAAEAAKAREDESLIIPGERIGRIRIGMPIDEVERMFGKPKFILPDDDGSARYEWDSFRLVRDENMRVYRVQIWTPGFKTRGGVGVGSLIDEARREWGAPSSESEKGGYGFPVFTKRTCATVDLSTGRITAIEIRPEVAY